MENLIILTRKKNVLQTFENVEDAILKAKKNARLHLKLNPTKPAKFKVGREGKKPLYMVSININGDLQTSRLKTA